jgi:hypothetical protein
MVSFPRYQASLNKNELGFFWRFTEGAMDTENTKTPATNGQDEAPSAEKKPIVDQLTDIAAEAAGQLAEAAVKSVAKRGCCQAHPHVCQEGCKKGYQGCEGAEKDSEKNRQESDEESSKESQEKRQKVFEKIRKTN